MELTLRITDPADMCRFASLLINLFPSGANGHQAVSAGIELSAAKVALEANAVVVAPVQAAAPRSRAARAVVPTPTPIAVDQKEELEEQRLSEPVEAKVAAEVKAAPKAELESATATTTAPTTATPAAITPEQMRALATSKIQADKSNGAKIKAIVETMGATAISNVGPEYRAAFMEQVNAL